MSTVFNTYRLISQNVANRRKTKKKDQGLKTPVFANNKVSNTAGNNLNVVSAASSLSFKANATKKNAEKMEVFMKMLSKRFNQGIISY